MLHRSNIKAFPHTPRAKLKSKPKNQKMTQAMIPLRAQLCMEGDWGVLRDVLIDGAIFSSYGSPALSHLPLHAPGTCNASHPSGPEELGPNPPRPPQWATKLLSSGPFHTPLISLAFFCKPSYKPLISFVFFCKPLEPIGKINNS